MAFVTIYIFLPSLIAESSMSCIQNETGRNSRVIAGFLLLHSRAADSVLHEKKEEVNQP